MSGKMRILTSLVVIAIVVAALGVWIIRGPGPLDFAGGTKVALADYRAGKPTGVPAKLEKASVVERGEYLAKAADCMVCHTKPGEKEYSGGLGFKLAVRHALFDQHHAGQGHRHRQLQRPGFPQRGPARHAS
ncbi:cytochrome c553 [Bradyrhizobium sp. i1.4.4]